MKSWTRNPPCTFEKRIILPRAMIQDMKDLFRISEVIAGNEGLSRLAHLGELVPLPYQRALLEWSTTREPYTLKILEQEDGPDTAALIVSSTQGCFRLVSSILLAVFRKHEWRGIESMACSWNPPDYGGECVVINVRGIRKMTTKEYIKIWTKRAAHNLGGSEEEKEDE